MISKSNFNFLLKISDNFVFFTSLYNSKITSYESFKFTKSHGFKVCKDIFL